ncbi:MAG TPA: TonB-dependent receptor [Bacteroidia bacterium]|nr:TonB-dependent receptor [Bacteroidia bacterium]
MFQEKKNVVLLALLLVPFIGFSQYSIYGKVKSKKTEKAVHHAIINLKALADNTSYSSDTDKEGSYNFSEIAPGKYVVTVFKSAFKNFADTINISANQIYFIELNDTVPTMFVDFAKGIKINSGDTIVKLDDVIVSSTRSERRSAMAYSKLNKQEIKEQNLGQDLPYLLNQQPSIVTTSDAGTGVGYTGIRIRGSDATRVNVTINGIPVNDAESQGAYWVDLPDIASSIDNIQIQRGAGTSTNGAGAFGGSLNIQTTKLNLKPYGEYNGSYGSFNTWKNTVNAGTGLIDNKFAVDARLSKISSNGFIDRGTSDLKSYYLSGAYYGKSSIVKFITFSGLEETYQAWNGIPEARLKGNAQDIEDYINRNYLDQEEADHLRNSNSRTYNQFTYANQVDHYQQDYYQLHYTQEINSHFNTHLALHYTKGKGYYEEYKKYQAFSSYGLSDLYIGGDTITQTNLVRRRWLDNDFYGGTFSVNYNSKKNFTALLGGAWNQYVGQHYGNIVWAQFADHIQPNHRYYNDTARKTDVNVFVKLNYLFFDKLNLFVDIQERNVYYTFMGYSRLLDNVTQGVSLNFINPKVGVNYDINENANVYASYSIAHKEPGRNDYTQSTPQSRPKPEELQDLELGYRHQTKKMSWGINLYNMNYKDQLIVTGQINDVGSYIHMNVPKSYRRGIEAEIGFNPIDKLTWNLNATFSENKIKNFQEFTDNYDAGGQDTIIFKTSDIAFSPSVIAGSTIAYELFKNFKISFISKYVGEQFLDNTSNKNRKLDAFFVNDVRINYTFKTKFIPEIGLTLAVNNVFNHQYESNGYTFGYISGGQRITENFYYPQAGVNFLAGVHLKF